MRRVPFIGDAAIARKAAELVQAHRRAVPAFALPYALDELIWDHLNSLEGLSLDEETPLGIDPVSGDAILGKTVLATRTILIDPDSVGKPWYRFTLAHEIGHWVLHCRPHLASAGQTSLFGEEPVTAACGTFETLHRTVFNPGNRSLDPEEIQANRFAACLLMPEAELRAEYRRRFGEPITCPPGSLLALGRQVATNSIDNLPALKDVFGASIESMTYRLHHLALIGEEDGLFA